MTAKASFSKTEVAFIRRVWRRDQSLPRPLLYRKFVDRFGRLDVSYESFKYKCRLLGLKTSCNVHPRWFSKLELDFLEKCFDLSPEETHERFVAKFGPTDLSVVALRKHAANRGFRPTANHQRSYELGSERIRDGFIQIKTDQVNPRDKNRYTNMWFCKHILLWERKYGPVPKGYRLKCIDGNRTNTAPSNWACVPIGVIIRIRKRNFNDAPTDLRPTIITVAKLEHALSEAKRG